MVAVKMYRMVAVLCRQLHNMVCQHEGMHVVTPSAGWPYSVLYVRIGHPGKKRDRDRKIP